MSKIPRVILKIPDWFALECSEKKSKDFFYDRKFMLVLTVMQLMQKLNERWNKDVTTVAVKVRERHKKIREDDARRTRSDPQKVQVYRAHGNVSIAQRTCDRSDIFLHPIIDEVNAAPKSIAHE